ncbi:MAG: ATP-binding protein [Bacillota bacterium]|nr:ATP-binding protein [Bacillota bacterium]
MEIDRVIVEIKDTGQGVAKEAFPFIFDRLYRVDPSRNIQGSGLGLAIARRIIEEHGGQIWAQSEKGKGISIFISLKKDGQE